MDKHDFASSYSVHAPVKNYSTQCTCTSFMLQCLCFTFVLQLRVTKYMYVPIMCYRVHVCTSYALQCTCTNFVLQCTFTNYVLECICTNFVLKCTFTNYMLQCTFTSYVLQCTCIRMATSSWAEASPTPWPSLSWRRTSNSGRPPSSCKPENNGLLPDCQEQYKLWKSQIYPKS